MSKIESWAWAREEFGHATLGHSLRVKAAVRIASGCAERPAGKVTEVFRRASDRTSAFRWVENAGVESDLLGKAANAAAARRCAGAPFAYVPIDKSSLSLADSEGGKGF